jgi:thymidylate kinase
VETFAERRQQYGVVDPLDAYDLSFYREVASVYHQLVENDRPTTIPEYWITVDAERSQEEVLTFVQSQILTSMWVSGLVTSTVYPA